MQKKGRLHNQKKALCIIGGESEESRKQQDCRMTRSKGPAEEVSLPPTRIRKDVSTANEGNNKAQGQVQANEQSQQPTADTPSPFA